MPFSSLPTLNYTLSCPGSDLHFNIIFHIFLVFPSSFRIALLCA